MRAYPLASVVVLLAQASCVVAGPPRAGGPDARGAGAGDATAPAGRERARAAAGSPADGPADERAGELASLVNAHRLARGCEPLRWSPDLAAVAASHSVAMRDEGFFGHVDPEGRDASVRVRGAGITSWRLVAENLALTPRAPAEVLGMWLDSPGHRGNIENCALRDHGVGRAGGYWTHLFTG